MAHNPTTAVFSDQGGMFAKQGLNLSLNRLLKQPPGAVAQNLGQRILERPWLLQSDNAILGHGVSLLSGKCGWLVTATIRHPLISSSPTSSLRDC